MRFVVAIITLLLLSLSLVPPLDAQNSYTEFERGLNLTESQRKKVGEVRERYIREWQLQRQEALRKRLELNDLRKNPYANRDRIDRTQRELRNIERSWEQSYGQYRSDLSHVLNERQRNQYNQFTEWERRNRSMPQGYRGFGTQRQGPMVREGFQGPTIQRRVPVNPEGLARPGMQGQRPVVPDGPRRTWIQRQGPTAPGKRGFPVQQQGQGRREMRGYGR
jgi:Spy/CpxP family protein refolding chaperone